jgi:(2Fe-2S) ferredoxin
VRANRAGCLDACEAGVTVVVYPEGVWYARVTPDDVDTIIDEHIMGGRPVEHLRIPESYFERGPAAKIEFWTAGRRDSPGSA